MSFLNPVNEPVLRFKSTDAGAPQINYNLRTAGDVKNVLKACLIDGYGTTNGAGWTAVNETATVAEFVSPSVAMSDYRLGIDDSLATKTTWYYQYQDVRVNPVHNAPTKSFSYITKTHANNGWQLLVTDNGFCLIEMVHNTPINAQVARVTWFGQMKVASPQVVDKNISYWCAGYACPANIPYNVFTTVGALNHHYDTGGDTSTLLFDYVGGQYFTTDPKSYDNNAIEVSSPLYLTNKLRVMAQHPAVVLSKPVSDLDLYGVKDAVIGGRPAIKACVTISDDRTNFLKEIVRYITMFTDYWEY